MDTAFETTNRTDVTPTRRDGRVSGRWIAAAAAIGLMALSLALAAPASAHGSHGGADNGRHHAATVSVHPQGGGAMSSTPPSRTPGTAQNAAADPPAGGPAADSPGQVHPGHDKCKAEKGRMLPDPPWCTDPSAGWEQSSLNRTDASFPTLPGAQARAHTGRTAASRGATVAHVTPAPR